VEIADRQFLSPHPVRHPLHDVYAELDITSRAQPHQLDLDDDPGR
jgi:DNA-binding CsgD family transcriptional regulator